MDKMIKTCVLGALALFSFRKRRRLEGTGMDEAVKAKLQLQAKICQQGQQADSDWIKVRWLVFLL